MGFQAETVYVAGHIVGGEYSGSNGEFLTALHALRPNQAGVIEMGRIAELDAFPELPRLVAHLGEMSRHPLPSEDTVQTVASVDIDPATAERFRSRVLDGEKTLRELPDDVVTRLDDFALGVSTAGALHIRGFKVDGVGPETALALADRIGTPYAEANETNSVVQTIQPRTDEAQLQSSGSFDVDLDLHVENVGQNTVPDFIVLVCERNEEQAETVIVSPLKALWAMRKKGLYAAEALLWRSKFWVRTPASFGTQVYQHNHAVIEGHTELPAVHADFADVGSEDSETREAYRLFQAACLQESQAVVLQAGEALLLRNTGPGITAPTALQVMHGRRQFTPSVSRPRILHRVYAGE